MARAPNKKAEEARKLYQQGMPLVEIAKKINTPAGTVRRWKSTYKWNNESERSDNKTNARKEKNGKPVEKEVELVLENTELTEKQRLFCLYFIKSFNATKAYQKAYQCDEYTARANGSRMLTNANIKIEIDKLKKEKLNQAYLSEADIFQKYLDIAMTDITDFMTFGNKEIDITDKDGSRKTITVSQINIKNDYEVDGTLISEISQGRDGIKVKLLDKMKALDWLAAHMGMATEEQKVKVKLLLTQEEVERKKLESADGSSQAVDDWIEAVINEEEGSDG